MKSLRFYVLICICVLCQLVFAQPAKRDMENLLKKLVSIETKYEAMISLAISPGEVESKSGTPTIEQPTTMAK